MNIAVIGSKGLAKELGKRGTSSDITLYNTSFQGKYLTFVEPELYPEKVQTLFQSLNMSQYVILYITPDLPKNVLGECIIAIDMLKRGGIIVLDGIQEEEIRPILNETFLRDFPIIESSPGKILDSIASFGPPKTEGKLKVIVDHFFLVKSVGTVVLGTVMGGEVKRHDKLKIFPNKKDILIKSIQIHDKDCEKASLFDRVGFCIKGVEVDELKRGCVISNEMDCLKEVDVKINKNRFFKEGDPKGVMCLVGLQYVRGILEGDKIIFENEIAYDKEPIIILTPDKFMRIFGVAEGL